jgi:phage/plasmid-associated DNA primase
MPASSQEHTEALGDLASPVAPFLRQRCKLGEGEEFKVRTDALFEAWRRWCGRNGVKHPGVENIFGRNLRAAARSRPGGSPIETEQKRRGTDAGRYYLGIRLLTDDELRAAGEQSDRPIGPNWNTWDDDC